MPFFIVRAQRSHTLVGFFSAENTATLFDVVDEVLNPFVCEFAALPSGSGVFLGGTVREEPLDSPESLEEPRAVVRIDGSADSAQVSNVVADAVQDVHWQLFSDEDFAQAYGLPLATARALRSNAYSS